MLLYKEGIILLNLQLKQSKSILPTCLDKRNYY
jgi:hypothetical protein